MESLVRNFIASHLAAGVDRPQENGCTTHDLLTAFRQFCKNYNIHPVPPCHRLINEMDAKGFSRKLHPTDNWFVLYEGRSYPAVIVGMDKPTASTDVSAPPARYRLTATQRTNEAHFDLFIGDAKIGTVTHHLTIRDKPFRACLYLLSEQYGMFGPLTLCANGATIDEALKCALDVATNAAELINKQNKLLRSRLVEATSASAAPTTPIT